MPNQRKKDKRKLNVWLNRALYCKLELLAKRRGKSMSELITEWISIETATIELTAEQYEEIARRIREETASR